LISIGQLCNDNCTTILDKHKIKIFKNNTCVLSGTRNTADGLWDIPIPTELSSPSPSHSSRSHHANAIIRKDMTKTKLAQYLYGCCGSPVPLTWQTAIGNGNFITWSNINSLLIKKHLPKSTDSAKGHMDQERNNLQSTKTQLAIDTDANFPPQAGTPNNKTFAVCATIHPFVAKNTA
jgi:hypothetical protein